MSGEDQDVTAAKALARCSWQRFYDRSPKVCLREYPDGEPGYVHQRWPLYLGDARAVIAVLTPTSPSELSPTQFDDRGEE